MSIDLKKKNLENLVYFYASELRRVQNGEDPYEILTRAERGRLLDTKILCLGRGDTRFELTLEAKKILEHTSQI